MICKICKREVEQGKTSHKKESGICSGTCSWIATHCAYYDIDGSLKLSKAGKIRLEKLLK